MPTIYIQTDESKSLRIWRNFYNPTAIICLEIDEPISDEVLYMIPSNIDSVQFGYNRESLSIPFHFTCSAEALGKCNLKSIIFGGNVDEIDDSIFKHCTVLERVWFGGSTKPVLEHAPNLLKCPLTTLGLYGWGMVETGADLLKIHQSIETQFLL